MKSLKFALILTILLATNIAFASKYSEAIKPMVLEEIPEEIAIPVLEEMNIIISKLPRRRLKKCNTNNIKDIYFELYDDLPSLNKEFLRIEKLKGLKRTKRDRKQSYQISKSKNPQPVNAFNVYAPRLGIHMIYALNIDSIDDKENIHHYAHELVHVVCGTWHEKFFK